MCICNNSYCRPILSSRNFNFESSEFRDQLREAIDSFAPNVVIIDRWNAASRDEKARSMLDTFGWIRSISREAAE
jgi:hypothetical protein